MKQINNEKPDEQVNKPSVRWRVTFEVDLGTLVPDTADLQPHDYPQEDWARQALYDMLFHHALVSAMTRKIKYPHDTPEDQAMRAFYDEKIDIAEQAIATYKMERLPLVKVDP